MKEKELKIEDVDKYTFDKLLKYGSMTLFWICLVYSILILSRLRSLYNPFETLGQATLYFLGVLLFGYLGYFKKYNF